MLENVAKLWVLGTTGNNQQDAVNFALKLWEGRESSHLWQHLELRIYKVISLETTLSFSSWLTR